MMNFEITELYYHPVKSLSALPAKILGVDDFGFINDRRFMLIDGQGKFVSQRALPILSLLKAEFFNQQLIISNETIGLMVFDLKDFKEGVTAKIWSDTVEAKSLENKKTELLSLYLGINVRLVYMPETSFRQVDKDYFSLNQRVSFADGFPFLLTNQASLDDLNSRLDETVSMRRFRPNIVFSGSRAFQEDQWKRIRIGEIEFEVVKPCSRCVMTTVDSSGKKGREPLKTLSTYRRNAFGICFGQNLVHLGKGAIQVGDRLTVLE